MSETNQDFYDRYWNYASSLRNWLIIYAAGGAVLLFKQNDDFLNWSPNAKMWYAALFFFAFFSQIFIAFINKWYNWAIFKGKVNPDFKNRRIYKSLAKLSECHWIDIALDTASIVAFLWAACIVLFHLTKTLPAVPAAGGGI